MVYRPSLIWSWGKLDVLPIIPVFNLASALGVPFVDRTIRVGTLADAIVAGIAGDAEGVSGFCYGRSWRPRPSRRNVRCRRILARKKRCHGSLI